MNFDPILILAAMACLFLAATKRLRTGFFGTVSLIVMACTFALACDDSLYRSIERIQGTIAVLALCVLGIMAQVAIAMHSRRTDWMPTQPMERTTESYGGTT